MTDAPTNETTRTFRTPLGPIVAALSPEDGVVRARGVRYANADRFARPRRTTRTTEPFEALRQPPASPQLSSPAIDTMLAGAGMDMTASEDCLRLTVTAPADVREDEHLPVMVWIHGGSYVTGAGDVDIYDPVAFVREQRVIVVAVTYRLGMFGFLGDGERVPANLGLLDLIAALEWVHECIASFGGDPDTVTLFGQSSGADAIAHLMISDGTAGLFRRVVMQSAPLGIGRGRAAMSRSMLRATGVPSRTAPVEDVLALQPRAERAALRYGLRGGMPFGPQYGQAPLPEESDRERAWAAIAPDIDLLIGSTEEETGLYAVLVPPVRVLSRVPLVGPLLRRVLVRSTTRRIYTTDVRRFAARHRAAGGRAVSYELRWAPEGSDLGAAHITDLPLLLGTERSWSGTALIGTTPWSEIERRGRRVRALWAEFARTGTLAADAAAGMSDTIRLIPT